jgi:hypothetical protein
MADIESDGISDEILAKAQTDIQELLGNRKLPKTERVQLEIQSYFLMFLINDHKKIGQMYPFFKTEKERLEKNRAWWERFQWVIIPMAAVAIIGFVSEFFYFWITVVPDLQRVMK